MTGVAYHTVQLRQEQSVCKRLRDGEPTSVQDGGHSSTALGAEAVFW